MKKIVAAIDFSDISTPIIEFAESMAQATHASLDLLHAAAP